MWKDIVLSIGMSIGEALCINQLDSKKRKKHSGKIESILQKELEQFSDSSLDNPSFHSYVKGLAFKQHMQGYFYTNDFQQNHVQSYKKSMVECVSDAVPNIKAD